MKKLTSDELELLGFTKVGGKMSINRDACLRINWLITAALRHVGVRRDSGGWDKLFQDPADRRYWMLTYPYSEYQGGGPPALKCVSLTDQELAEKFATPEEWAEHMKKFVRERNITEKGSNPKKE